MLSAAKTKYCSAVTITVHTVDAEIQYIWPCLCLHLNCRPVDNMVGRPFRPLKNGSGQSVGV